jgi:hypothetical protein
MVGPQAAPDPINAIMAASPLPQGLLPGPRVLGPAPGLARAERELTFPSRLRGKHGRE